MQRKKNKFSKGSINDNLKYVIVKIKVIVTVTGIAKRVLSL